MIETTLSVDCRPCVPARHLVPPFSIVLVHLFRRQYRHSENGRFLIQTERTRDLVADSRGSRPQLTQQPKPLRPK
jgi:hypothetical protein